MSRRHSRCGFFGFFRTIATQSFSLRLLTTNPSVLLRFEFSDLIDSEGVFGVPNRAASSVLGTENLAATDEGDSAIGGFQVEPQRSASYAGPKIPEQLSANGRAVLRKFFAKAEPVTIPMGHPTVAFTEPQLHAILRTISLRLFNLLYM